jgi:hypothetical protein
MKLRALFHGALIGLALVPLMAVAAVASVPPPDPPTTTTKAISGTCSYTHVCEGSNHYVTGGTGNITLKYTNGLTPTTHSELISVINDATGNTIGTPTTSMSVIGMVYFLAKNVPAGISFHLNFRASGLCYDYNWSGSLTY